MLEIAKSYPDTGIFQKDIAENQNISVKYLDHIIQALKVAGLITNVKGKKSGYTLSKEPEKITLYDIHHAFEPGICVIDCLSESVHCDRQKGCTTRGFWSDLNNMIKEYLKSVTLQDLVDNEHYVNEIE